VAGAALATVLSVGLEVAFIAGFLFFWKGGPRMSAAVLRSALSPTHVRHFLRISIPLTVGGVVWHTGAFVYQAVYGHLGETELAVISMVQPVRTILFAFFWGISSATGVILGHHLGAGEFAHAWHRSKILIVLGIAASLVAAGLVTIFEMPILSLFAGLSPETLQTARDVLAVMLLTIPILAANVVGIVGVLQSGADTRFVLAMDVFCQWAVGIPLCWLAAFHFDAPLHLVYLAAFGEEIIKVFIWVPRWAKKAWVRRLVNPPVLSGEEQKCDEGEHGEEDEARVGNVAEERGHADS
jgi:Na+-driven multidrug efflux pump